MVSFQPDLSQVIEFAVFRNEFGIQVTVVVDDGQASCMLMVQLLGHFIVEHEVLIHELFS